MPPVVLPPPAVAYSDFSAGPHVAEAPAKWLIAPLYFTPTEDYAVVTAVLGSVLLSRPMTLVTAHDVTLWTALHYMEATVDTADQCDSKQEYSTDY